METDFGPFSFRFTTFGWAQFWLMLSVLLSISLFSHPVKDSLPVTDTVHIKSIRIQQASSGRFQRVLSHSGQGFNLANNAKQNGIFIKQYGIGGLATISRRGADATQTQILWNGIPVNNPSNGVVDFGLQSTFGADVRLLEGGNSASFGSGAVGGVVAVDFDLPEARKNTLSAIASFGSFQMRTVAVDAAFYHKHIGFRFQVLSHAAKNDFSFRDATPVGWQTTKMPHAEVQYEMQRAMAVWKKSKWQGKAVSEIVFASRGLGKTLGSGLYNGTQFDRIWRNMADVKYSSNGRYFSSRIAYMNEFIRFDDPKRNTKEYSNMNSVVSQTEFGFEKKAWSFNTGLDVLRPVAITEGYAGKHSAWYPAQFAVLKYSLLNMEFSGIGRFEWHEKIPVYTFSTQIPLYPKWVLKASAGTSFRRPTMNDLYWIPGGNPALLPEKGRSAEAGLQFENNTENWKLNSFFCLYTRDLTNPIVWNSNGAVWSADNLFKGKYHGLQFHADFQRQLANVKLFSQLSYDYTFTQMELLKGEISGRRIFVPDHVASVLLGLQISRFSASLDWQYTGLRYVSNDNSEYLNAFHLLNAECSFDLRKAGLSKEKITLRADNLLNKAYFNMPGRPMPGRSFIIQFNLKI